MSDRLITAAIAVLVMGSLGYLAVALEQRGMSRNGQIGLALAAAIALGLLVYFLA